MGADVVTGYENWDARRNPAWVACPTCGERVEMPVEGRIGTTPDDRFRFVHMIVVPFAHRLANACRYAQTRRHA